MFRQFQQITKVFEIPATSSEQRSRARTSMNLQRLNSFSREADSTNLDKYANDKDSPRLLNPSVIDPKIMFIYTAHRIDIFPVGAGEFFS